MAAILPANSPRIVSIDALRGFDMFWITGGDAFFLALFALINTPIAHTLGLQLEHVAWEGFRFYDLIFPLFLFIMGVSMPLSITRRLERGYSKGALYRHVVKRTLVLFILGLVYNGLFNLDFGNLRYTGVLQRFSVTYLFAALIVMNCRVRGQSAWIALLLLGYWLMLLFIPAPGFHAYDLTPQGNLCGYIDRQALPGSMCCYTFGDNEGILSMIPAVASVLFGVMAGRWLLDDNAPMQKLKMLAIAGLSLVAAALVWSLVFPVIKNLWTGSYVLLTAGISMLLLGLFFWIIDVKGYRKWAFPFVVIGMNPITIYIVQGLFDFGIIANIFIHGFIDQTGSLKPVLFQFSVLAVKWLFLWFLYSRKIFLRV